MRQDPACCACYTGPESGRVQSYGLQNAIRILKDDPSQKITGHDTSSGPNDGVSKDHYF